MQAKYVLRASSKALRALAAHQVEMFEAVLAAEPEACAGSDGAALAQAMIRLPPETRRRNEELLADLVYSSKTDAPVGWHWKPNAVAAGRFVAPIMKRLSEEGQGPCVQEIEINKALLADPNTGYLRAVLYAGSEAMLKAAESRGL